MSTPIDKEDEMSEHGDEDDNNTDWEAERERQVRPIWPDAGHEATD